MVTRIDVNNLLKRIQKFIIVMTFILLVIAGILFLIESKKLRNSYRISGVITNYQTVTGHESKPFYRAMISFIDKDGNVVEYPWDLLQEDYPPKLEVGKKFSGYFNPDHKVVIGDSIMYKYFGTIIALIIAGNWLIGVLFIEVVRRVLAHRSKLTS
ncbi:MAG: DUF3592 domain-containing protein [Victivallaceae bacterium]|nr:DUF3592 domain-containing protein [Victivallaceae bacterium]